MACWLVGCGGGGETAPDAQPDVSPAAGLVSFSFLKQNNPGLVVDVEGHLDGTAVELGLPIGSTRTGLIATFTGSGTVTVAGVPQESNVTAHDFASAVTYTVTSTSEQIDYTVNVALHGISAMPVELPAGQFPSDLIVADFNGDGRPDIVETEGVTAVFINTTVAGGMPTFERMTIPALQNAAPGALASQDLNGDNRPDLAVIHDVNIAVSLNTTPTGNVMATFAPAIAYGTGPVGTGAVIGDFTGDGVNDIAVSNAVSEKVSVLRNTTATNGSAPSFVDSVLFATGTTPSGIAAADFNADGKLDLVTSNNDTSNVSVLMNTNTVPTALSFATKQDFTSAVNGLARAVTTADFNGDGRVDLAVANNAVNGSVAVLLNTTAAGASTPTFASHADFPAGLCPYDVATGDFNGDGRPDIVIPNQCAGTVSLLLNTTPIGALIPTFAADVEFGTGRYPDPRSIATADINGDGLLDIIVLNPVAGQQQGGTIAILLGD